MVPIIAKKKPLKTAMIAVKIVDLIDPSDQEVLRQRFQTDKGVVQFIVDFADYMNIFGPDLTAENVKMERSPSAFNAVVKSATRLRKLIYLDDSRQISSYRITRTSVFVVVNYEDANDDGVSNF